MPPNISRRSFLKGSIAAAGTVAASQLPMPRAAHSSGGDELCTLLNLSKCIGCEACVEACRESNQHKFPVLDGPIPEMYPPSRVPVADWSSPQKREVSDRLTPYNWLYIQSAEGEYNGESFELNIPRRCMHCRNAPCVNLCPFGAAYKQTNGIVRIHPQICMGGAKCKKVCPWKIPERQSGVGTYLNILPQFAGNGVMYKCDRCYDRIAQGQEPACIEVCPEDVQQIGPRSEILARARDLAAETGGHLYGDIENGGTNTIYISPIPFEVLAQAVEKGPGRPHLNAAADAMASVNRFAWAVALAPVAGVIGALGKLGRPKRDDHQREKP